MHSITDLVADLSTGDETAAEAAVALLAERGEAATEVLELLEKGDEAVMSIRNFGEKSLDKLRQKMREKGYLKDGSAIESE